MHRKPIIPWGFPPVFHVRPISVFYCGLIVLSTTLNAEPRLAGRAILPAATFSAGPTSGKYLGGTNFNSQPAPFVNTQPVQGFSATIDNGDGSFLSMSDNGFGSIENSADYLLRVYKIRPSFKTANGGNGSMAVESFIELKDPDKHVPFTITHHFTSDRVLTGADFDIESMQKGNDGTLWFGDEFGPFILHTDAQGKLLEPPIALPDFDNKGRDIRSPQNPMHEESSAVRIMNAVRHHAMSKGNTRPPIFSPWHVMIDDRNTNTFIDNRLSPPTGSGLKPASSEVFDVASIQRAGYHVVTWTVNDKPRMLELLRLGINGIISDRPDLLLEAASEFDKNNDGITGDLLTADGLIDISKFDAQGHRGGRNLRPENTLPSMEVALDMLMTTLELDTGIPKDGVPILSHDPYIEAAKARRSDGAPYEESNELLIKDLTSAQIQTTFIADKVFRGASQINDRASSPVSVAFAASSGLIDPYVLPTLQQVFDFVEAYVTYYTSGPGKTHPEALKRAKNAARIRFNIETKINPRTDKDLKGIVFAERTFGPDIFARAVGDVIAANQATEIADIQSFDFRSLLAVQERYPSIRTVYLFGDFPIFQNPNLPGSDDGTNLQDQNGENTPWLAGMFWPYRVTRSNEPFRSQRSGGFEGMAISDDRTKLYPLLEKPLVSGEANTLLIHEFDIATRKYTGNRYKYPLNLRGTAIGDFQMFDSARGLIIERDETQGNLNGFKAIYEITLAGNNQVVSKDLLVDLMQIEDPNGLSIGSTPGDVGLGKSFAFPFVTIENVIVMSDSRIGVINDNNYPFSVGRHVGSSLPDDNEFILIDLDRPLGNTLARGIGPDTTVPSYYPASPAATAAGYDVQVINLLTLADPGIPSFGGYKFVGLPDGLGALDNGDGTFSVYVNHEIRGGNLPGGTGTVSLTTNATTGVITTNSNAAVGVTRAYGGKGAFVSEWVFNKADLSVVRAGDLIREVQIWTGSGFRTFDPSTDYHFSGFCSADLPEISAFFDQATGFGTKNRIFMNGEEDGKPGRAGMGGRAFAHLLSGPDKGRSFELPYLGKFAWENSVASPFPQMQTIVMGLDDSELTNSQVYVYIGKKQSTGLDIEKAGLHNGKTYAVRVEDQGKLLLSESNDKILGTGTNRVASTSFALFEIGDASKLSELELDSISLTNSTSFFRVEDGSWDPNRPEDFYFLTTGRVSSSGATIHNVTHATRMYRLRFADIKNPLLGGTISMVLEGPAGTGNGLSDSHPVMMDNMTITKNGTALIQEDPGNYVRLAKTWSFDLATSQLVELTRGDSARFLTDAKAFLTQDEEASGIIDISDILGEGWTRYAIQSHYRISGELVEGGQLGIMRVANVGRKAPSSSIDPYYLVSHNAAKSGYEVELVSLATVGDTNSVISGGYKAVGLMDGMGAFDNNDGTFTLLVSHEIRGGDRPGGNGTITFTTNATTGVITTNNNAAQGSVRAHGAKGAFISEWIISKTNLSVLRASDLIKSGGVRLADGKGGYRLSDPATDYHISRLCSADLPEVTAFFNPISGKGTRNRIYMAGEEDGGPFRPGQGGRAFATLVSGPDKGLSYELPYLGKFAWENAVASPFPQDLTVVMGLDDSELNNSQVYVYLGQKTTTGIDVQKAGLTGGNLFGIRVIDNGVFVPTESNDKVLGLSTRTTSARFLLHDLGDASKISADTLDADSLGLLNNFQRVEDGAWDPNRPNEFYFVTTGRVSNSGSTIHNVTHATRLWRIAFDDISRPELGGWVELVLDGPAGTSNGLSDTQPVMMDNMGFTRDGKILLQEDPGNYDRLAKVWIFDPQSGDLANLATADPKYFTSGAPQFLTRDEEASGIIDVSDILGKGWSIWNVQVHNRLGGELVEGGQLLAMRLHEFPAYPSIRVQPIDQSVEVGNSLIAKVNATGSGPFTYQWLWNGTAIPGANDAEVELYNLAINQAGDKLSVRVTGPQGSVTSQAATIKINPATGKIATFALHPIITVNGTVGGKYRVEYKEGLESVNVWKTLTEVTLTQPTQRVMDETAANNSIRVYRIVTP